MKNVLIRLETEKDYRQVEEVARAAFWRDDRIREMGVGAAEHYMIHAMRKEEGITDLSFIAEIDGEIVGQIAFGSGSYIELKDGCRLDVLNMGPLSVKPGYQNKGIGGMLINRSIEAAKKLGFGAVFFYGHKDYYPRFGFKEAKEYNITTSAGNDSPYFMGMELKEGYLKGKSGRFIEGKIYHEDYTGPLAKVFDQDFH